MARKPMTRRAAIVTVLVVLFAAVATIAVTGRNRPDADRSDGNSPIRLVLSQLPKDRDRIRIRVQAINQSIQTIGWDSEFTVNLNWTVELSSGVPATITASSVEQSERSRAKTRFIKLESGRSASKDIEITTGVWRFVTGHGTIFEPGGMFVHLPNAYEELIRFEIPTSNARSRIYLEYAPGMGMDAHSGFVSYFGFEPAEVGLWQGGTRSNVLRLQSE